MQCEEMERMHLACGDYQLAKLLGGVLFPSTIDHCTAQRKMELVELRQTKKYLATGWSDVLVPGGRLARSVLAPV